jgi:predicted naringenin-chalcone synthase
VLPAHKVTTAEIVDDIRTHHFDHPRLKYFLRVVANTGVSTRYFTRPLNSPTISGAAGIGERAEAAFNDALDLGKQAARRTLDAHQVKAADVDAIITTHSTGWSVPNLDIHLVDRLGLRPNVSRIALTTMACAGGTQALIRAVDMVTARPGSTVLVVASEVISAVYNHQDDAVEHMIYKALFGDSAAATLVTDQPLGPGLRVDGPADTYEHVLPNSLTRYSGRADAAGFHFDSTKEALTAADDVLPHLLDWLGRDQIIDWAAIHPGSGRIITDTATALGLDAHDSRHSTDTLTDEGNLGAVSVLRVLERTHDDPPPNGAHGVAVAYGPGFNTAAIHGTWGA